MGDIDHPNILKLKEFLESSKNYYIVMQYCNKGDFESYLSKQPKNYLEEKEALYFLKQIMNGFQVLRQKEVMHRDFKLANIFLNNNTLVIGDFGFARAGHEMAQTNVGTPLTKAPELHKNVVGVMHLTAEQLQLQSRSMVYWSSVLPIALRNLSILCSKHSRADAPDREL